MSNASNSMNRVMKTLTIVATIFIPLTFIVGIYGMNFQYMPELQWEYGYPAIIGVILLVALVMIIFMNRKKWF
jgi:magnesium transporter